MRLDWDKYESALMLESYLLICEKKVKKEDGLKQLSDNLRQMAINRGYEIDSVFRNYNGMQWQYSLMDIAFRGVTLNGRSANKEFQSIVQLYKEDNSAFLKVLDEAKRMFDQNEKNEDSDLMIINVMKKYYPYGYRFGSVIENVRFSKYYESEYGVKMNIESSDVVAIIKKIGFEWEGKLYLLSEHMDEMLDSILFRLKERNQNIAYYSDIYKTIENDIDEFVSEEIFIDLIQKKYKDLYYKKNYFSINKTSCTENSLLKHELNRVWGENVLNTVLEIKQKLLFVPEDKIKYALSQNDDFVWNSQETYALTEYFYITDEEKKYILEFAQRECGKKGYFNLNDLYLDDIKEKNYELSEAAIFDCIMKKILVEYGRRDKVVRRREDCRSQNELLADYAKAKDICSLKELTKYQLDIAGTVRIDVIIDAVSEYMIRIDEYNFLNKKDVHFDVEMIDGILDDYFSGFSIGMKEVVSFVAFPECGVSWNLFVLESYLKVFSEKFKYVTNNTNSGNAGAIVKKDCKMEYFDILCEAVLQSKCKHNKEDVLEELVSKGYLLKKYYKKIDLLLQKIK